MIRMDNLGLGKREFSSLSSYTLPYCGKEDEDILSEEEEKLFTVSYWVDKYAALASMIFALDGRPYHCSVLTGMRDAYISIKERGGDDSDNIKSFLKDQDSDAKGCLFHLALCIIQIKNVSCRLHEIAAPLLRMQYQLFMKKTQLIQMAKTKGSSSFPGCSEKPYSCTFDMLKPSTSHCKISAMRKELDVVDKKCLSCSLIHLEGKSFTTPASILASLQKFFLSVGEEFLKLKGKPQTEEGNKLSMQIYSILLVLKEMLINLAMSIHPAFHEGCKKLKTTHVVDEMEGITSAENLCFECNKSLYPFVDTEGLKAVHNLASTYNGRLTNFRELMENHFNSSQSKIKTGSVEWDFVDNKSTELMRLVEASVNQLRIEMLQKVDMLTELLNRVYNSFPPDSDEYRIALGCHQQGCDVLEEELENKLRASISFLCSGREEFIVAFRKLIGDLIEPRHMLPVWYPKCEPW